MTCIRYNDFTISYLIFVQELPQLLYTNVVKQREVLSCLSTLIINSFKIKILPVAEVLSESEPKQNIEPQRLKTQYIA